MLKTLTDFVYDWNRDYDRLPQVKRFLVCLALCVPLIVIANHGVRHDNAHLAVTGFGMMGLLVLMRMWFFREHQRRKGAQ